MPRRPRSQNRANGQQSFFFFSEDHVPPVLSHDLFPNNYTGHQAGTRIKADLRGSHDQLVITGFTSLEQIIDYLADFYDNPHNGERVRILLGHEPALPEDHRLSIKTISLPQAFADYWLDRGVSILQCSAIVAAIEVLKCRRNDSTIEVRASDTTTIHAKIYAGDSAITTGSSNFSRAGLTSQIESNVRFTVEDDHDRWRQLRQYAEWVWSQGRDYLADLIVLLEELLRSVSWQEALARACAEVLEGEWARHYLASIDADESTPLWPSQRQGIAQALWIMENLGSVLVADATGSGKTRMGAHLIKAAVERMWRTGQKRIDPPLLTCPRSIEGAWDEEFSRIQIRPEIYTHGILSRPDSKKAARMTAALRQVQVFAIDEAHNFLDHTTQRTRTLYGNLADYVVLFTATPINKGVRDLVAMVDALGADNFDDDTLELLRTKLWRRPGRADLLSPDDRDHLRHALERFMVRRTIPMLNNAIDREPDAYRDASDRPCRYPHQRPAVYRCPESDRDREIGRSIREEAAKLRGLIYLGPHLTPSQRHDGSKTSPENELQTRLEMANSLAAYHVISSVRSSRAALIEHISGTEHARREFSLSGSIKAQETGNHIRKLETLAGHVPENAFPVPLPPWLTDPDAHREACRDEVDTYRRIADLTRELSDAREVFKAGELARLLGRHRKVVAFDWHLISLAVIKQRLDTLSSAEVLIATGANNATRKRVRDLFDPDVNAPDVPAIALCSDAMSESIGLQRASALVHLDMPSTIRKAEQRVGRLMRMNSPHPAIDVYWPMESETLALRADAHMVERHQTVDTIIGANIKLPHELAAELEQTDELFRRSDENENGVWDELGDAFAPVRALIEGDDALLAPFVYDSMRTSKAHVISSVSIVQAEQPWAFFAIAGTEWGAPRWVYLDDAVSELVIDLDRIAGQLRGHLGPKTLPHPLDAEATDVLKHFVDRLIQQERSLLPRKKQRALEQMVRVLKRYRKTAQARGDLERVHIVEELRRLAEHQDGDEVVDLRDLADCWLGLINPLWTEQLRSGRRRHPLRLRDLDKHLLAADREIATEALRTAFENAALRATPLDRRIVSAIVGVP